VIGTTLGPFRVVALLGSGGMGQVYRARDDRLGRDVAVKVLAPEAGDAAGLDRLLREARMASALNHPNICTLYEVGEEAGRGYIAMELAEGKSLRDLVPPGGMAPAEVVRLGVQIADALSHAHEQGVIHRDLKTANVMVTPAGRVKVLDFGLARRELRNEPVSLSADTLAGPGLVVGTPQYMAPEVLLGSRADARSDLWALGIVLHELCSGAVPFQGPSVVALCDAILHQPPAPLPKRVSPALRAVIERLLEKDPERRYRTVGEVCAALEALRPQMTLAPTQATRRRRWLPWTGAGAAAIAIAWLLVRLAPFDLARLPGLGGAAQAGAIRSLAVLPLANLSGDPSQEFFADGMTEELITQLAPIDSLKVISRTSVMQYKGTKKTIPQIARELGVGGIVEGSVMRSGDRVRIIAQLIEAASDRHLWAQSYERDLKDVLALQREVARDITAHIRLSLSPAQSQRLTTRAEVDPEAYDLYLRGRYDWSTLSDAGVRRAIGYYQQAIARNPRDARSYAGISDAYIVLAQVVGTMTFEEALPRSKAAAEKALALDPGLAEAHASMAAALLWHDRDWAGAEKQVQQALRLNPGYPGAHLIYNVLLRATGRHEQSIAEARRAIELDPLSLINNYDLAWSYYQAHQFDEALAQVRRTLEIDPHFSMALVVQARIEERLGRFAQAIQHQPGLGPELAQRLLEAYRSGGARGYWQAQLALARAPVVAGPMRRSQTWLAYVFAGLGQRDSAFAALDRAFEQREGDLLFCKEDPALDPLRDDPRMAALIRRMGLPS